MSVTIIRPGAKRSNPYTVAALVSVAVVLATVLIPVQAVDPVRPVQIVSSNLKQLAMGHQIYLLDNNEVHPIATTQKSYRTALSPYFKNDRLFTEGQEDFKVNIVFNPNLSGIPQSSIPKPDQTITLYTPLAEEGDEITHYIAAYANGEVKTHLARYWPQRQDSLSWTFPASNEVAVP